MAQKRVQAQVNQLYQFIYCNILNIPSKQVKQAIRPAWQIEQAIILVSVTDQLVYGWQRIINTTISKDQYRFPKMQEIQKGISVIYPTDAFLNPQTRHNFVSMHYLMNTVNNAKFIFVFNNTDFKVPMINVKQAFINFIKLFKQKIGSEGIGNIMSKGCGIIVNEANRDAEAYISILTELYKEGGTFVTDPQVKSLVSKISSTNKFALFRKQEDNKAARFKFCQLLKQLQYVPLEGRIQFNLQSAYKTYKNNNISQLWTSFFIKLYKNLGTLVTDTYEKQLKLQLQNIVIRETDFKGYEYNIQKQELRVLRLSNFIQTYFIIIGKLELLNQRQDQVIQNYRLIKLLLQKLYQCRYLQDKTIAFFMFSYFQIYSFLSQQTDRNIFERVNFNQQIRKPEIFNENMTSMINYLYVLLQSQLNDSDISYPFDRVIKSLGGLLQHLQSKKYPCITERTIKKISKKRAELAYKKAQIYTNAYNKPLSQIRQSWVQFLQLAQQASLIQPLKVQTALYYIADELTKNKSYKLALKVYSYMPAYKSYKKVIAIYERDLKFNPEVMKYIINDGWANKNNQFQDYCYFLLKIGFNQKVRELCIEALRNIQDEQSAEDLKGILINARGENSRDIHNRFLQNLSQQPRKSQIQKPLLKEILDFFNKV